MDGRLAEERGEEWHETDYHLERPMKVEVTARPARRRRRSTRTLGNSGCGKEETNVKVREQIDLYRLMVAAYE